MALARLYTPAEAAEYFHVSLSTIYRWVGEGCLGFRRVRGGLRFTEEDFKNMMETD